MTFFSFEKKTVVFYFVRKSGSIMLVLNWALVRFDDRPANRIRKTHVRNMKNRILFLPKILKIKTCGEENVPAELLCEWVFEEGIVRDIGSGEKHKLNLVYITINVFSKHV